MVQVEILVNAIQKRPIIWDKRNKNYYNGLLSYREWEALAKEVGTTSDAVKKQWKNLKDTFIKEIKKVRKPRSRTNADNEPKYTGTWPYFEIMSFLSVVVETLKQEEKISEDLTGTSESNSMSEITVAKSRQVVLSENVGRSAKTNLQEPLQNTSIQPQDSVSVSQDTSLRQMPSPSPSRSLPAARRQTLKRKQDNTSEAFLEIESKKLKILRQDHGILNSTTQDQQDSTDDDLVWFRSILPFMKELPPIKKLHFRTKMQEILLTELSKISS